ncbi:prolactin regulatory element-binding protein [Anopheles moucheti]|uniref:prolactin regulatory element-binding protein n=1 Tax=Anopheles moucheti TaxID=186751 RepID=UPI0022F04BF7|nr:prolactin regulatory element-binding protein [Anopheles moucheti]
MSAARKPTDGLLARVNFPLYAIEMLTSRHVLVAGGGGASKTGVANGFEIYEIYHDGEKYVADEVIRHETGPTVVMNCAVKNDEKRTLLMAGQESHCQMYLVNTIIDSGEYSSTSPISNKTDPEGLRKRRSISQQRSSLGPSAPPPTVQGGESKKADDGKATPAARKQIRFEIKTADSVQTDFTETEPLQRVVRISPNGRLMATGGMDGHLRVWNFPKMTIASDIAAHTKEIDDLDFSPDSKHVVSIAKDGLGVIWSINPDKESKKLVWNPPANCRYLLKRCRYGLVEGQKDKFRLFTLANPFAKSGKAKGLLQQWDPEAGRMTGVVEIDESLAALAVRDDGRFVAIGTMFSGSVSVYIAFSLQRVLHVPNAHAMFVTGLEFLPVTNFDGPAITGDTEAAVLSISVDNRICVHSLPYRHSLPAWVAIIAIICILFLTFCFCSYVGL